MSTSRMNPEDIVVHPRFRPLNEEKVIELMETFKTVNQISPITVRFVMDGGKETYVLVVGNHRLQACLRLGIHVMVKVIECSNEVAAAMEISENLHRNELTALEKAEHLSRWISVVGNIEEAAKQAGVSTGTARDAAKISAISPAAKEAAKAVGLDKSAAMLSMIASENYDDQVSAVGVIIEAKRKSRDSLAIARKTKSQLSMAWERSTLEQKDKFLEEYGLDRRRY
jgi:ParB family chromosome partitioning protein